MCPFKKAFPFVVLVHLLAVVGVVGVRAQHQEVGVFTLMPAIGAGEGYTHYTVAKVGSVGMSQTEETKTSDVVVQPQPAGVVAATVVAEKISQASQAVAEGLGVAGNNLEGTPRAGGAVSENCAGGSITPPIAIARPKPMRPEGCVKGEVVLTFTIDKNGVVGDATIEKSPSGAMSAEVLKVLPRWKFAPARKDGQVMSLKVRQVVEF